jgi:hypothetical protein
MNEYNHWRKNEREQKRKDRLDKLIFFILLLGGGLVLWIL